MTKTWLAMILWWVAACAPAAEIEVDMSQWARMSQAERNAWLGGNAPGVAPPESATGTAEVKTAAGRYAALQWQSERLTPMVLHVGMTRLGAAELASNGCAETLTGKFVVALEYGDGAAVRRVELDPRTGAVQLPPVRFVQVAILKTFSGGLPTSIPFALSEGESQDTDVPSFTTEVLTGAVPAGARAVELLSPGTLTIGGNITQIIQSDWTVVPQVFQPPFSPVRITGTGYTLVPAAAWVNSNMVRFLLSL